MEGETLKVGALCAGYGGLELGLQQAGVDFDLVWYAETDKHASEVMAFHYPTVPNLGDLVNVVDPDGVDVVTAGFPCQPVSLAGKRLGVDDERWLIDDVCRIAREAGADWLILENVAGLLSANGGDAMARVVAALAANGFAAEWTCVRASDVGEPHQRLRWFCVGYFDSVVGKTPFARDWGPEPVGEPRTVKRVVGSSGASGSTVVANTVEPGTQGRVTLRCSVDDVGAGGVDIGGPEPRQVVADSDGARQERQLGNGKMERRQPRVRRKVVPDADCDRGNELPAETDNTVRAKFVSDGEARGVEWGPYADAIARWEPIAGRGAPEPTDDQQRLNPRFVEWMMGLPDGWVTDAIDGRSHQLRILGNGVVPQQAALAVGLLLQVISETFTDQPEP